MMLARRGVWWRAAQLACVLSACESRAPPQAPAPPVTRATPAPATGKASPSETEAAPTRRAESEVRASIERWLRAQNDGDFAAYAALYAARFSGIKRAGPRVYAFDREAWMKDRARMFQKPMLVKASNISVRVQAGVTRVDFVQRWANDAYQDEGPKRLWWVREGETWRISREEMLRSEERPASPAAADLRFVMPGEDPWVVLERAGSQPDAPTDLALAQHGNVFVARRPYAPEAPALAEGTLLALTYASGETCQGRVDRFGVAVAVVPHFGEVSCWDDPTCDERPASELQKAQQIFGSDTPYGVAHVQPTDRQTCAGQAVFARPADAPPVRVAKAVPVPEGMDARFRSLPAFRKRRPACAAEGDCALSWKAFRFDDADVTWVVGLLSPESCGGDQTELWASWRVPGGDLDRAQVRVLKNAAPGSVEGLLDLDQDGAPELLVRDWVGVEWRIEDPRSGETLTSWGPGYHDCPC